MVSNMTLSRWEADYLLSLMVGQENNLWTNSLIAKLMRAAEPTVGTDSARRTDPRTSKAAGESVKMRAGSQKHILLCSYMLAENGLTDEEAGEDSGLAHRRKCCYWKRCSELRQAGFIAPTGETRLSSTNEQQQVCAITEAGKKMLSQET